MKTIPFIICIDVEPDEREIEQGLASDWIGFEEMARCFNEFRPRLREATGAPVNFSWFFRMDPQIGKVYGSSSWVFTRYREIIKQLELAGDELGLHTHAWRWEDGLSRWITDHGNQEWIDYCVHTSFQAYEKVFGRSCRSFRFGDRFMNNETMGLIESLGVRFDLTIEPGRWASNDAAPDELGTGSLPNYMTAPRRPYVPSSGDFRTADRNRLGLLEIPLTTGKEPGRFAGLKRAASALNIDLQRRHEATPMYLNFAMPTFRRIMNRLLDEKHAYLSPLVRSEVAARSILKDNLKQNMELMLSHPSVSRFKFAGPAEAIEFLAGRNSAKNGET